MRGRARRGLLVPAMTLTTVLVAVAAATVTACSDRGGGTPEQGTRAAGLTASPAPAVLQEPPVTLTEAERALSGALGAQAVLESATPHLEADRRNLLAQTRDSQEALTMAAFNSTPGPLPHYTWGKPELLVPRVQWDPFWFAAVVEREDSKGEKRSAVLVMTKYGEHEWYLSSTSLLDPEERVPEIAKDAGGYATELDDDDPTTAISPRLMAPLHATSAEEGSAGFAAGLIEKGPHTTGYAEEIAGKRPKYKGDCLGYDSIFGASNYPVHALRTADGGAMVMYSLIRTTTVTAKIEPCADIRVPPNAERLASATGARKELRTVETQQYVSTVPAKTGRGPARVIGYLGGVTKVSAN
ncbi:hypothetical protein [Streptosporangium saharense]|uniref:DUF8094 domain-containing protein n=1 Tax=Streptosporangium saharense TaxID=1706840 RepID=A0A7W7QIS7_9ACTN|nr:hypothetical protein [Streptosporangium saharense]MBB4914380.1 hypothetical protein [Streptosporangium saharense]